MPLCASVYGSLVDTLSLARDSFPGKRNNLDALCERFAISSAHRTLHGALLDARLLADVYLAMTRGQETLSIDMGAPVMATAIDAGSAIVQTRWTLEIVQPSAEEVALHREYLEALDRESKGRCVWLRLDGVEEAAA